jgi:hypothetical protein
MAPLRTVSPAAFLILSLAVATAAGTRAFADAPTVNGGIATPTSTTAPGAPTPKPTKSAAPIPVYTTVAMAVSAKYSPPPTPTPRPTRSPNPKPSGTEKPQETPKPGETAKPEATAKPPPASKTVYKFEIPLTATKLLARVKEEVTGAVQGSHVTEYKLMRWYVSCVIKPASGKTLAYGFSEVPLDANGDFNKGSEKNLLILMDFRAAGTGTGYQCDLTPGDPLADEAGTTTGTFSTTLGGSHSTGSTTTESADLLNQTSGNKTIKGTGSFSITKPAGVI